MERGKAYKALLDAKNCQGYRSDIAKRMLAPSKKISFDRKQFAPYLDKLGSDQELEKLFLEFLRERLKVS